VRTRARARAKASRNHARARWSLPPIILTSVLALIGCGSSDNGVASKSATEILAAAGAAARSASSVHVTATNSLANGKVKSTLDASLAKNQGHAKSSFLGVSYETIRIGDTLYVKGNQAFATQLEHAIGVKIPPETWLKGSTSGQFTQLGSLTSLETELPLLLKGKGTVTKGARTKVSGQPAIALKLARKLYTGTLYVATTGHPYPLKLTKTGREAGQSTFSEWNDPVTVSPPPHAIDISQLEHKKGH
jgi:hypothetical protein